MIGFVEYVVSELRSKKLSKADALALIREFSRPAVKASIHPLVHRNVSRIDCQRYLSIFSGDEFFLKDHRVHGQSVLPGVAYLEMARVATAQAYDRQPGTGAVELRNVVWAQPIVVSGPREVAVSVFPEAAAADGCEQASFEIHTGDGQQETIHCQGHAAWIHQATPSRLDLEQLKGRMTARRADASAVYTAFVGMGVDFGPAFRGIEVIHRGKGEVLAELRLPAEAEAGFADFKLHPTLVDGALEASIGLAVDVSSASEQARVPFAMESMRILAACARRMYAWVRYSPTNLVGGKLEKLDVDLCDEQGSVCIEIRGFSSRAVNRKVKADGVVFAVPEWRESELAPGNTAEYAEHHILLCELPALDPARIESSVPGSCCVAWHAEGTVAQRYRRQALACLALVQSVLQRKPQGPVLFQLVISDEPEQELYAGLLALIKTASLENPRVAGQLVVCSREATPEQMADCLREESEGQLEREVSYSQGVRRVRRWRELDAGPASEPVVFKDDGVYLVTGGLGGLGLLFARETVERTSQSSVILVGRSALTDEKRKRLDEFSSDRVSYRQVDVSDRHQVEQLIGAIERDHRRLNGIIHAAGITEDSFILDKTPLDAESVLAPKVDGVFHLDAATRDLALDFFVLFSSIAGVWGNVGQADYAAANAFLDGFASYRNRLVLEGRRQGRTLSIAWPLWKDGGMGVDAAGLERIEQTIGMRPMESRAGIQCFYRCLASSDDCIAVVAGDAGKIRRSLLRDLAAPQRTQPERPASAEADSGSLIEKTRDFLRKQLSGVLKLPPAKIDVEAPLEIYGIDSILAMKLTGQLEEVLGPLPKTLFFEYQTLAELAAYIAESHTDRMIGLVAPHETKNRAPERISVETLSGERSGLRSFREGSRVSRKPAPETSSAEPIAVIGLSGRYPQAMNIDEYWRNLREGRDCITEVPIERWDWREFFSQDRNLAGHHYSKWGGFIAGVDTFDPLFFNISPADAELIDPQERLFLQHAWMAIEDAGYTRAGLQIQCESDLPGQVGVYVGVMYGEYQLLGAEASMRGKRMAFASNLASIANRVSYFLNLHGPSMTLDTMCSSSLTAIHLALQDLKQGRTSLAIAGGVNVTIHPNKYLMISAGQFISSDGHCQSFGQGGDGYIPAEGVGVVILKRLSEAVRDGDHIYGVIRGSAVNHGGKTNGYSVPNPQAQAGVIRGALVEAQVDPRHISYLEAHGTGTKLGDPIEIAALSKAFDSHDTGFCMLGSAKSNIGHCESAAGVAGLTKVLLQMQHREIAPSLHSTETNPHIDFDKTPFVVNQTLRPWDQPVVDGRKQLRRAGISSFGAGGSNAHMIVEEYPQPERPRAASGPAIIPLSARTAGQLETRVRDLFGFLSDKGKPIDLGSVACTLQLGREAMEERLSLVVNSVDELREKLNAYLRGEQDAEVYRERVTRGDAVLSLFAADRDLQQTVGKWIAGKRLSTLAELWARGLELDWRQLYGDDLPQRVSLPTYPFAQERYWVETAAGCAAPGPGSGAIHPLLHRNTSDLSSQRYSSTFTGWEFFLADHELQRNGAAGRKVLPGVIYLEMARAAVENAVKSRPSACVLELHDTVWLQPLFVTESRQVQIALAENEAGQIEYEIYTEVGGQPVVHCQGRAAWGAQPEPTRLDLEKIKSRMERGTLAPDTIYRASARMGLTYGRSLQAITSIHRGENDLLAELHLPESAGMDAKSYALHPSIVDGALQSCAGLFAHTTEVSTELRLPSTVKTVCVVSRCTERMFAWVRRAPDNQPDDRSVTIDIDLCDESGNICVQLRGLALRKLSGETHALSLVPSANATLLARPVWRADHAKPSNGTGRREYADRYVIVCELPQVDTAVLQSRISGSQCEALEQARQGDIARSYHAYALACFERIRELLRRKTARNVLLQFVVPSGDDGFVFEGISALLRTAAIEHPEFAAQAISVGPDVTSEDLARLLEDECARGFEPSVRYEQGQRHVLRWQELPLRTGRPGAFKDGGVYLITGGLGGLGLVFAAEIILQTVNARVVLTGRSELTAEKKRALSGLPGDRVSYRQVDLGDREAVQRAMAEIQEKYGPLHGILHSAGETADRLILHKASAEFSRVLEPKVAGTFNLDEASRDAEMDFFVLFSSVSGATGNTGQADYAVANAFMDRFAAYRNRQVASRQRHGHTVSINWPLWQAGGMTVDPAIAELLEQATGMRPMPTEGGLDAFRRVLDLRYDQVMVMHGDPVRLRQRLLDVLVHPERAGEPPSIGGTPAGLREELQTYLQKEFSEVLKLPSGKIDPNARFEEFGIDSIVAMKLTNRLEKTFGPLPKTLFFEYQTTATIAGYFWKEHSAKVQERIRLPRQQAEPAAAEVRETRVTPARRHSSGIRGARADEFEDIAIVGLAGRYPQAENLRQFWENLRNGRDCISEIPPERWNHSLYFDADSNKPGKSYSKWGGFIGDIDKFDPLFFNISPKEAELLDPQERLFLQTAWHAIEDAGYSKASVSGRRIGVYVGVMWGQYELYGAESVQNGTPAICHSSYASVANRVSYFLDLRGPSLALDTMCSSSLTAIHMACEDLRKGNMEAAIAGGVNVTIHPYKYLSLSQGKFAATDGKCRAFGEGGDGYVPGEGVGAVLLKPLAKALRDGDHVYAVVKASSVNHGGRTNGYTVPNPNAQGELIADALRKAGVAPQTLGYIEAHGTGTALGDPIEIAGLEKAFEGSAWQKQSCAIGSVKSNIGHLESAAGIAAVTKVVLQMAHKQLVPSLHSDPPNPNIDFARSPFHVQTALAEWEHAASHPRRAGISSFGAGGSNAHLILEEYRDQPEPDRAENSLPQLFVLSARDESTLAQYARSVVEFLETGSVPPLAEIAYTSQIGRTPMAARLAILAADVEDLRTKLTRWSAQRKTAEGRPMEGEAGTDGVFSGTVKDTWNGATALMEGRTGQRFLEDLLSSRELEKIARFWILGAEVDWALSYRNGKPKRVSLPLYPFARERCWIQQNPVRPVRAVRNESSGTIAHSEERRIVYYAPRWTVEAIRASEHDYGLSRPILLLDTSEDLFRRMKEERPDGAAENLILLRLGGQSERTEPDIFAIDPAREEQFGAIVDELAKSGRLPGTVLHHSSAARRLDDRDAVEAELLNGVYSIFSLSRTLMQLGGESPARVLSVASSAETAPFTAAMMGFFNSQALEGPSCSGRVIEFQRGIECGAGSVSSQEARLLWAEILDPARTSGRIRYRTGEGQECTRHKFEFAPCPDVRGEHWELPLKRQGVYVITGGLGGLGLVFSEYLARRYAAKLVLVGRSECSPEQERKLRELNSLGAETLHVQADVAKREDMERVVRETKARFSRVDGVIHAAGVIRDSLIRNKTRQDFRAVLASKVHGAINVDLATSGEPLDFVVFFSSVAGVFGNVGQSDYAYGNCFLDSLAEFRETLRRAGKRSGRTLSIDWPLWEAGGMGLSREAIGLLESRAGICPLPTDQGIRCMEDLLGSELAHGMALYGIPSRINTFTALGQATTPAASALPSGDFDPATLRAKTEAYLKELIGDEIKLAPERIGSSDRLESYGLDSVMISRINSRLERELRALPKTLFYERESVQQIASFLLQEAHDELAARFQHESVGPTPDAAEPDDMAPSVEIVRSEAEDQEEPIAIIGMHGYYPHSVTLDEFWENLKQGRDLIDLVPTTRWNREALYDPDPLAAAEGKIYAKWGGFLDDYDKFDARFFNIPAEEARLIDPQERLFLESVWAAIEDSGYTRDTLKALFPKGRSADVGVFVGVTTNSYHLWAPEERSRGNAVCPSALPWSIANRVSYFFDFSGPSMPVDTACSSSLVAMHLACESLRKRECSVAIAGGVNLYLHPSKYQSLCQRQMLSRDGKCYSYGAGGDGFVPGEGVGSVVLKKLSKAIEDGDRIHAVVRASAFDHAGRSNGYSAPNPNSQARLIRDTLRKAGIDAETIGFVEGHGTGTQLGDSIEIAALTHAFATTRKQYCPIGSVKANIGHAESAAGIAGLAKVVLQMKHGQLAPSIHSEEVNPNIEFVQSPFYLQHELSEWAHSPAHPRRALINSFGAGGVNACVILEEFEESRSECKREVDPASLFVMSAESEDRLREYAGRLCVHLKRHPEVDLVSACYTLQTGREPMSDRLAMVVSSIDDLCARLDEWTKTNTSAGVHRGSLAGRAGLGRSSNGTRIAGGGCGLDEIASRWVGGEDVVWAALYNQRRPRRVSLPTYPFLRERHWISDSPTLRNDSKSAPVLHQFISHNSSTLREVSFSSCLSEGGFYSVDHKVNGSMIFPGAGYLEIACMAGYLAGEKRVRTLRDVAWVQPLRFQTGFQTLRTVLRDLGGDIEYVISSVDEEGELVLHSEGRLGFAGTSLERDRVPISELKAQCQHREDGAAYYRRSREFGFEYGPSFQSIQELYRNGSFALARLNLPEHLRAGASQFVLHPSIIDGAIQTAGGLAEARRPGAPRVPFALDELLMIRPVPENSYAYVELAEPNDAGRAGISRFNIQVVSEQGDPLILLKNLYVRELSTDAQPAVHAEVGAPA